MATESESIAVLSERLQSSWLQYVYCTSIVQGPARPRIKVSSTCHQTVPRWLLLFQVASSELWEPVATSLSTWVPYLIPKMVTEQLTGLANRGVVIHSMKMTKVHVLLGRPHTRLARQTCRPELNHLNLLNVNHYHPPLCYPVSQNTHSSLLPLLRLKNHRCSLRNLIHLYDYPPNNNQQASSRDIPEFPARAVS
jgi:hypothetical protein